MGELCTYTHMNVTATKGKGEQGEEERRKGKEEYQCVPSCTYPRTNQRQGHSLLPARALVVVVYTCFVYPSVYLAFQSALSVSCIHFSNRTTINHQSLSSPSHHQESFPQLYLSLFASCSSFSFCSHFNLHSFRPQHSDISFLHLRSRD